MFAPDSSLRCEARQEGPGQAGEVRHNAFRLAEIREVLLQEASVEVLSSYFRRSHSMSFCTACGVQVQEQAAFCSSCGTATRSAPKATTTKCPFCAEEINANARKCKYCGEFVDSALVANGTRPTAIPGISAYYAEEFRKISSSGQRYKGKWNWAAFFFGGFWAISKGLWVPSLICFIGAFVSGGLIAIAYWFIFAARGNYMYYCKQVNGTNIAI